MQNKPSKLSDNQRPIMVASHERSGTHFMMNSLDACFDYVSRPWVNFDRSELNFNFYQPLNIKSVILALAQARAPNIVKSHHEFAFFADIIADLKDVIEIVYVHRNPADVMSSYWRFVQSWEWVEGPKAATVLEFATAAPMGNLMRYQYRQYETMLHRWANHVEHWVAAAERSTNIHVVRYEDLARRYEVTVKGLGTTLGLKPRQIVRPSRTQNVVAGGSVQFAPAPGSDNHEAVTELARSKFPDLMTRLGYDGSPARRLLTA